MADTRTYGDVSEAVFDCVKEDLQQYRFTVPGGTSGTMVGYPAGAPVHIEFSWDGSDVLELEITSKPSFVPALNVWNLTDGSITGCGGSVV